MKMSAKKIIILLLFVLCVQKFPAHADDKEPIRLGVMKFLTRAEGVTEQQAAAIGDIFARLLANSKSLMIVERDRIEDIAKELQLAQSGVFQDDDVIKIGKLISCKYMLVGSVTNLERKVSETDLWIVSEKHHEISATIDIRVVDMETSKVIMALSESGSASRKGQGFNFYGIESSTGKIFEGIEEAAIAEAVFRMSFKIRESLAGERIQVVNVTAKDITVNAGQNWGIGEGAMFAVYSEGKEVFNLDGSSMGRPLTLLAAVKISDPQRDFSYAQILKNGGKITSLRKGNVLKPITNKEANDLIKRKAFKKEEAKGKKTKSRK